MEVSSAMDRITLTAEQAARFAALVTETSGLMDATVQAGKHGHIEAEVSFISESGRPKAGVIEVADNGAWQLLAGSLS